MIEALASAALGWSLAELEAARERLPSVVVRTPLLQDPSGIHLKPELLQPLGSFKIRCAANAIAALPSGVRAISTASAGNFAQGLSWIGRKNDLRVTVHVPESAPAIKRTAIARLGGTVIVHCFARWWEMLTESATGMDDGVFVHPFADAAVIMGDASIGLEIHDDLPEVDTVLVPFGGGGLAIGIALALRARGSHARAIACEVSTAAPLAAAMAAGEPVSIAREPSFVDGIGSLRVLDPIWPLARALLADVAVVSPQEAAAALRDLAAATGLIAEGAAAVAYAAARRYPGRRVAVLTGRNIDFAVACRLMGRV